MTENDKPQGVVFLELDDESINWRLRRAASEIELPPATFSTDYHQDGYGVPAYTAEQVRELVSKAVKERDDLWSLKVEALMRTVRTLRDGLHGTRDTRGRRIVNEQLEAISSDLAAIRGATPSSSPGVTK